MKSLIAAFVLLVAVSLPTHAAAAPSQKQQYLQVQNTLKGELMSFYRYYVALMKAQVSDTDQYLIPYYATLRVHNRYQALGRLKFRTDKYGYASYGLDGFRRSYAQLYDCWLDVSSQSGPADAWWRQAFGWYLYGMNFGDSAGYEPLPKDRFIPLPPWV